MDKRYQVFVSSTYADLKEERQKVMHALMQMDCIPAGMELFPAADEEQLQFIKRIIDDCDYYLLIIGGRYGSVTDEGISYTEKEYEYALERKIKVIAFLHKNPEQISYDKSEKTPELREKLEKFRSKVSTGRLVNYWESAKELPGLVALSLTKTIKSSPAVGWVRADKVSSEELLTEINELRKKNEQLQKALSEVEPKIFTPSEEKDFAYIYKQLDRLETVTVKVESQGLIYAKINRLTCNMSLAPLVALLPTVKTIYTQHWENVPTLIIEQLSNYSVTILNERTTYSVEMEGKLADELLRYGLLTKNYSYFPNNDQYNDQFIHTIDILNLLLQLLLRRVIPKFSVEYKSNNTMLVYSEKMERYKYWLQVNNQMPKYF